MKAVAAAIGVLIVCGAARNAPAQSEGNAMSLGDLQQICIAGDETSKSACRFYILGVSQGISAGMAIADGKTQGGRPCVPENVAGTALELAVKLKIGQDLLVYPDDRKLDASGFVSAALISAFPCRQPATNGAR